MTRLRTGCTLAIDTGMAPVAPSRNTRQEGPVLGDGPFFAHRGGDASARRGRRSEARFESPLRQTATAWTERTAADPYNQLMTAATKAVDTAT